jgi:hypothetical protein
LYGIPGVGKTQLCVNYAQAFQNTNPQSCVIWARADSSEAINESYAKLLKDTKLKTGSDLIKTFNGKLKIQVSKHKYKALIGKYVYLINIK